MMVFPNKSLYTPIAAEQICTCLHMVLLTLPDLHIFVKYDKNQSRIASFDFVIAKNMTCISLEQHALYGVLLFLLCSLKIEFLITYIVPVFVEAFVSRNTSNFL